MITFNCKICGKSMREFSIILLNGVIHCERCYSLKIKSYQIPIFTNPHLSAGRQDVQSR
jgi:ArsR family metal-binding transcriptional regulator